MDFNFKTLCDFMLPLPYSVFSPMKIPYSVYMYIYVYVYVYTNVREWKQKECHGDGNNLQLSYHIFSLIVSISFSVLDDSDTELALFEELFQVSNSMQLNSIVVEKPRQRRKWENYVCAITWVYKSRMGECTKKQRPYGDFFCTKCIVKVTGVSPEDQSDLLRPECAHWSDHWSFRRGFANMHTVGSEWFWGVLVSQSLIKEILPVQIAAIVFLLPSCANWIFSGTKSLVCLWNPLAKLEGYVTTFQSSPGLFSEEGDFDRMMQQANLRWLGHFHKTWVERQTSLHLGSHRIRCRTLTASLQPTIRHSRVRC